LNLNICGDPPVVLSNLAWKVVYILSVPSTLPVLVAPKFILMLPIVEMKESEEPASMMKSSSTSPAKVTVLVPDVGLTMLMSALLTNFICAQVMLPFTLTVTGPVVGVVPPRLVPSKIRMSEAPVEEGLELPVPSIEVFQFDPVVKFWFAEGALPTQ